MHVNILETILCVLFTALIITVIFRRFNLPVILGYLLVGIVMGPHALGLMPDAGGIKYLAEFGIVFLMFTIGLEFSIHKLFLLKKTVFFMGSLQVLLSILGIMLVGKLLGMNLLSTLVIGSIVAMSSTAIVVKQLNDQAELYSPYGLNAVSILLFQDLAVIPLIILIVSLSQNSEHNLPVIFLWAFLKGTLAILLIYLTGKWLLRSLFQIISKTRAIELFTLTVLLITLTAAWLTNSFGLSYAFGAFLAGLMLAETEFRHQIEIEIRPFRDILLGLFFITIGMLTDISYWYTFWPWILLLLLAITVGKIILVVILCMLAKNSAFVAIRTGLVLAQGGEFGFAILTVALTHNILPPAYGQVALASLLISISIAPLLIRFSKPITEWLLPQSLPIVKEPVNKEITPNTENLTQHIIICGYGRVGQHIAKVLDRAELPYIGLDIDSELIKQAKLGGNQVIFGDATHPGILKTAGLSRAKALIISFNNIKASAKTLSVARNYHAHLPIIVRCKDQVELSELKNYGATKVVAELFEESLTISQQLLHLMEIPKDKISQLLQEVRKEDYDLLRKIFPGSIKANAHASNLYENLMPILLTKDAFAVNRKLKEFHFDKIGIEVIAVRRRKATLKPKKILTLRANDIVLIYGSATNIKSAEKLLMEGQ